MSHTPHELAEKLSARNASDVHFAKMTDAYHTVNRAIHRAETDVEPTDDRHMQTMRKERMQLKDQIWAALDR